MCRRSIGGEAHKALATSTSAAESGVPCSHVTRQSRHLIMVSITDDHGGWPRVATRPPSRAAALLANACRCFIQTPDPSPGPGHC